MTKIATGSSLRLSGLDAGYEAASQAAVELGSTEADLVLVHATTGYDQQKVLEGIASVFGEAPITGCSSVGVITQNGSNEDAHTVGLMAFSSSQLQFHTFAVPGFSENTDRCSQEMLEEFPDDALSAGGLLVLFTPGRMGDSTTLLDTLNQKLPSTVQVVGGAAGSILSSEAKTARSTFQYHNLSVVTDSVAGVFISGQMAVEVAVSHGCEPVGLEMEVTRAHGTAVEEIDHRPALTVFREYLPDIDTELELSDLLYMSVGIKISDSECEDYGSYIIRTPTLIDEERGSLYFAGGIEEGTKISMVIREPSRIRDNAAKVAQDLRVRRDQEPLCVLHFDCIGRGRVLFDDQAPEMGIRPLQKWFSDDTPWLGFYTFGEIAPLSDKIYYHNYTVALCAIYGESI